VVQQPDIPVAPTKLGGKLHKPKPTTYVQPPSTFKPLNLNKMPPRLQQTIRTWEARTGRKFEM